MEQIGEIRGTLGELPVRTRLIRKMKLLKGLGQAATRGDQVNYWDNTEHHLNGQTNR